VSAADERQAEALAYLGDWDGLSTRESVAATIFEAWSLHIGRAILEDELHGDLYERLLLRTYGSNFALDVLAEPERYRSWCEDVLLAPAESCIDTARAALDNALDELEERLGTNMERWKWGTIHRTQFEHTPFSKVPVLRRLFHRSIANGSSTYAVNLAASRLTEPRYEQYALPSYRHVIDLGTLAGGRFMTATGQSGNPLSAHYDDFIQRHRDVDYLPMTFAREMARGKTLMLQPQ
jgi:penicillin amidase